MAVDMNKVNEVIARIDEICAGREEELDQLVEARRAERAAKKEQGR